MKEIKKIHCVINTSGDIVGRFTNKKRAIDYMIDYYFDGYDEKVSIKTMTTEEYLEHTKKLIDRYK